MSEYPEDIRKEAHETIMKLRWHMIPVADFDHAKDIVAAAILAERERCAEIVRTEEELEGDPPQHVIAAMEQAGPVMNARSAVRATKASILKRMGAA